MWRTLDNQFIKVFDASVGTYYINKQFNKIIVILGIVLIAYALIYHTYSSFYLNQSNSITNQQQSLIDNNGPKVSDDKIPDLTGLIKWRSWNCFVNYFILLSISEIYTTIINQFSDNRNDIQITLSYF